MTFLCKKCKEFFSMEEINNVEMTDSNGNKVNMNITMYLKCKCPICGKNMEIIKNIYSNNSIFYELFKLGIDIETYHDTDNEFIGHSIRFLNLDKKQSRTIIDLILHGSYTSDDNELINYNCLYYEESIRKNNRMSLYIEDYVAYNIHNDSILYNFLKDLVKHIKNKKEK